MSQHTHTAPVTVGPRNYKGLTLQAAMHAKALPSGSCKLRCPLIYRHYYWGVDSTVPTSPVFNNMDDLHIWRDRLLESLYLDYMNNYLTIDCIADHNGLDYDYCATLIEMGRDLNHYASRNA